MSFLGKKKKLPVPLHFSNCGTETSNQLIFMVWGKMFLENPSSSWLKQTKELKNMWPS